jgi:hypothetical protein
MGLQELVVEVERKIAKVEGIEEVRGSYSDQGTARAEWAGVYNGWKIKKFFEDVRRLDGEVYQNCAGVKLNCKDEMLEGGRGRFDITLTADGKKRERDVLIERVMRWLNRSIGDYLRRR